MKRTLVQQLADSIGKQVMLQGFVDTIRNQKRMVFVLLRDHSGIVQIVFDKKTGDALPALTIESLTLESVVSITGTVVENTAAKLGGIEIVLESIDVTSAAETPLPIAADSTLDKQLDWRFLSLRFPKNTLVFQVQTTMERAMRKYWEQHGFIEIHSPKLMATASESGAELFTLEYFDGKATLAQSPQFYKQMAMAAGLDRIFEIGPVFRANPSFTPRHDTEFTSVDMEVSWITDYSDLMQLEEEWIHAVLKTVAENHGDEIVRLFGVEVVVPTLPFPRITLAQARELLEMEYGHIISHKEDLDPKGERLLAEHMQKTFEHEFVFVTDYPVDVRPFYHMRHKDEGALTKSFDLLWKGLEITTGAQREHRSDILRAQALEKIGDVAPLEDYLTFFQYGCPPHGGMGVGLTRLLMVLLGCNSVREVTYLYRGPNRLTP